MLVNLIEDVRLGIEGLVTFKRDTQFDAENYTITVPGGKENIKISVFDQVVVQIEVEKDKNTQRGKVKMTLLEPVDSSASSAKGQAPRKGVRALRRLRASRITRGSTRQHKRQ